MYFCCWASEVLYVYNSKLYNHIRWFCKHKLLTHIHTHMINILNLSAGITTTSTSIKTETVAHHDHIPDGSLGEWTSVPIFDAIFIEIILDLWKLYWTWSFPFQMWLHAVFYTSCSVLNFMHLWYSVNYFSSKGHKETVWHKPSFKVPTDTFIVLFSSTRWTRFAKVILEIKSVTGVLSLGLNLGLLKSTNDKIQKNHKSLDEQKIEVIHCWLKRTDIIREKCSHPPTWSQLSDAVANENSALSEYHWEKYCWELP